MKKILIGVIISGLLLITGCQSSKNDFIAPIVEAQSKTNNVYNVDYDLIVTSEENTINVELTIENRDYEKIPLYTEGDDLFVVKLKDIKGNLVDQEKVKKEDRKEILNKEKVSWNVTFKTNMNKELNVETELLLKSGPYNKFKIADEIKNKPVYVWTKNSNFADISFAPKESKIYIYQDSNKKKQKEEFRFFNNNKVQSFSKEKGVTIYSQEDDGLYVYTSPDPVGDIDGTEFVEKKNMSLLIPYPIEKDVDWKVGNKKYVISDEDITVKTKLDEFKHCVEITETDGKTKRYYYYQKEVGLIKIKKARKFMTSKTELELIKVDNDE